MVFLVSWIWLDLVGWFAFVDYSLFLLNGQMTSGGFEIGGPEFQALISILSVQILQVPLPHSLICPCVPCTKRTRHAHPSERRTLRLCCWLFWKELFRYLRVQRVCFFVRSQAPRGPPSHSLRNFDSLLASLKSMSNCWCPQQFQFWGMPIPMTCRVRQRLRTGPNRHCFWPRREILGGRFAACRPVVDIEWLAGAPRVLKPYFGGTKLLCSFFYRKRPISVT